MINNFKTYYGKGKFNIEKTINFLTPSLDECVQTYGSAIVGNLKLNLSNTGEEYNGNKVAGLETFSFNPDDFSIIEFTLEGLKGNRTSIDTEILLHGTYGVSSGATDLIAVSNDKIIIKRDNATIFTETTNYNIGLYSDRVRNLTLRINKNDNTIMVLEDGQVLINQNAYTGNLSFDKEMHLEFKIKSSTSGDSNIDIRQIKIKLFG